MAGNGLADPFSRPDVVALLMGNYAEQMKGVSVVGSGDEDPAVQLRCLVQEAALVLRQRHS
jgi:hypothetical protein